MSAGFYFDNSNILGVLLVFWFNDPNIEKPLIFKEEYQLPTKWDFTIISRFSLFSDPNMEESPDINFYLISRFILL